MNKENKPKLLTLRQKTSISTQTLAQEAGVTLAQAYMVEIGGFVENAIAEKVVTAFSRLTETPYTLDDIRFQNVPPLQ